MAQGELTLVTYENQSEHNNACSPLPSRERG
jgi:hypothetical protein